MSPAAMRTVVAGWWAVLEGLGTKNGSCLRSRRIQTPVGRSDDGEIFSRRQAVVFRFSCPAGKMMVEAVP